MYGMNKKKYSKKKRMDYDKPMDYKKPMGAFYNTPKVKTVLDV